MFGITWYKEEEDSLFNAAIRLLATTQNNSNSTEIIIMIIKITTPTRLRRRGQPGHTRVPKPRLQWVRQPCEARSLGGALGGLYALTTGTSEARLMVRSRRDTMNSIPFPVEAQERLGFRVSTEFRFYKV